MRTMHFRQRRPGATLEVGLRGSDAHLPLEDLHRRPQHGRRPRAVARHRHEGRRLREADHRHRQLLHAVRARPRAPQGPGPAGGARDRGAPAAWPRSSTPSPSTTASPWATAACSTACPRATSSPTGSSTWCNAHTRRRDGVHLQLRQDHARHADGGHAPEHPDRLRLGRADGSGQDQARRAHGST